MSNETITEILSITSDLSEVALDSILSDGLFKDLPIFGTIISVGNLTKSVSDKLLLTRILNFIKELDIKNQQDIDKIKEKYFKDKDYEKIGSKLLLILEKIDDIKKIEWLAESFRKFLDKVITRKQFLRISSIIDKAYTEDIEQISIFREREKITSHNDLIETYILDQLFIIGVLESNGIDGGDLSGNNSGTVYSLNEFGLIILNEIIQ